MNKRVDIELDEDILKWAGIEAAKLGISRRRFISNVVSRIGFLQTELTGELEFVHTYPGGNIVVPFNFDSPFKEYCCGKFYPSPSQRHKIWEYENNRKDE